MLAKAARETSTILLIVQTIRLNQLHPGYTQIKNNVSKIIRCVDDETNCMDEQNLSKVTYL